jgi:hypothetical protein
MRHACILKYKNWVEEAEKARNAGSLSAKENQYDKAEELGHLTRPCLLVIREKLQTKK